MDYYQLQSVDDIQLYDPQQPFRYSTVRIADTVMDVADLDLARQCRLLALFPQTVGYRQWKNDTPTTAPPVLRPISVDDDSRHSDPGSEQPDDDGTESAHTKRSSEALLIKEAVRILADRDTDLQQSLTSTKAPLQVPHSTGSGDEHDTEGAQRSRLPVNPDVLLWFGAVDNTLQQPSMAKPNVPYVTDYSKHVTRLFGFGHTPDDAQQGFLKTSRQPPLDFHQLSSHKDDSDVARAMRGTLQLEPGTHKAMDTALRSGLATASCLNYFARGARNEASELFHASNAFFKAIKSAQEHADKMTRADLEKVFSAASAFATQEARIGAIHKLTKATKLAAFYSVAPLTAIDANLCLLQRDRLLGRVASTLGDVRAKVRQSSLQQNRLFDCSAVKQEAREVAQHQVHLTLLSARSGQSGGRGGSRSRGHSGRGRQQHQHKKQQQQQQSQTPFRGRGRGTGGKSHRGRSRGRGRGRGGATSSAASATTPASTSQ